MSKRFPEVFAKSFVKPTAKNRLISFSLMWVGIGVAIIFLMTFLFMLNPDNWFINKLSNSLTWSILIVINLVLIIALSFYSYKMSLTVMFWMYMIFIFIEGIFVSTTISMYFPLFNESSVRNIFLLFLVPSGIFVIMGLLGFFEVLDFSKLLPFISFATLGLIIFSIFLLFFGGSSSEKWFSLLGIIIFSFWIGFDIWWIQRTSDELESCGGVSTQEMLRLSLFFGLRLFVDFVRILTLFLRLTR